ncbi:MAG: [FeFe] hydrogenase H-cluster maturation GTPase HydF [Pyramidobacter sp.]|nr:[FeFe] hydrogenase H-cluster maturation GTPase HydF [Pyramidobacter sp.]
MSLNDTPRADRLHIGIFGRRNSGKSSLINALTGQSVAIVSDVAGTTADPVYKSMEIHGIGPVVFIDTAGFDDVGELGTMRVQKSGDAVRKTDMALLVFSSGACGADEIEWLKRLQSSKIPVIAVLNKIDTVADVSQSLTSIERATGLKALPVSALNGTGIDALRERLIQTAPESGERPSITGSLCAAGDVVVLVMPQDIQAPQGRLILPQVQTIRELLDKKCIPVCVTTDQLDGALAALNEPPRLMIVDSQTFAAVYPKKPERTKLTSFSVLFAGFKGDIGEFVRGARAIAGLTASSRVLIAEACTHAPLEEDIGRVKIPRLLRQRFGDELGIDIVRGADFPEDLCPYSLVIHCGACMFNRRYVLSRIAQCRAQGVPITNYGVVMAYMTGILEKIDFGAELRA